ncbi:unnamed protein product, partial [Allacma fusca]
SPQLDWRYLTTSQKHSCLSLKDQKSLWPRGKALGGTSNLNFMVYIRGHPFDYDNWAYLTGDDRWNYKNLLPYFLRSENYNGPYEDGGYHGHGGPLNIEVDSYNPLTKYFLEAAQEMGYPRRDLNAPYNEAFSEFDYTKKNGRRWGSYQAFIQSIRKTRKNLTIRKYALVSRVLFKGSNNVAHGVEYEHHYRRYIARAKNEVIISAGTVASPKILMQSGIGPQYHLSALGINPLVNSPAVGANLQDHVIGFTGPFTIEAPLTFLIDRDTSPKHFIKFMQSGQGPLSASGVQSCGLVASNFSKQYLNPPDTIWPDLQLILFGIPVHKQGPALFGTLFHLKPDVAERFYRPVAGKDSFHIMSIAARPKSRGKVLLGSKNPRDPPVIDPNYLSEKDDVEIIKEGMKKAVHMVENTKAFQSIGAKLSDTPFPSCAHLEFRSDPYWECYIREYT